MYTSPDHVVFPPPDYDDYNVPGNVKYLPEGPTDVIIVSRFDTQVKGYWMEYNIHDGQLTLACLDAPLFSDNVSFTSDPDNTPVIQIDSASVTASVEIESGTLIPTMIIKE